MRPAVLSFVLHHVMSYVMIYVMNRPKQILPGLSLHTALSLPSMPHAHHCAAGWPIDAAGATLPSGVIVMIMKFSGL